jgi:hypothetical protein
MFLAFPWFASVGIAEIDSFKVGLVFWTPGMDHLLE